MAPTTLGSGGPGMGEKGTVLIVDDSPADRAFFRTILARGGYTVFESLTRIRGGREGPANSASHHRP